MRALILSDVHANLEALNAVLKAAAGSYDTIWNLGDLVGYGASPNQVLDLIRPLSALNVRGNHDRVCCGLTSALGFNPVARAAANWTKDELTPDNLAWLRTVASGPLQPEQLAGCAECPAVTCAHGSPLNEDHYILNMRDAWAPLQQMPTAITFLRPHPHSGRLLPEAARLARAPPPVTPPATTPNPGPSTSPPVPATSSTPAPSASPATATGAPPLPSTTATPRESSSTASPTT